MIGISEECLDVTLRKVSDSFFVRDSASVNAQGLTLYVVHFAFRQSNADLMLAVYHGSRLGPVIRDTFCLGAQASIACKTLAANACHRQKYLDLPKLSPKIGCLTRVEIVTNSLGDSRICMMVLD